jgi:dihydroflavonol-4-reductase
LPTAFVTGASGFVGANLVLALLARDWSVRTLVRGAAPSLDGLDVSRVTGDLFVPGLSDAMRGSDAVFHVAALYSLWRRDRAEVMRANVEGTRLVLGAARRAGVPRVVHTSSVAAIGVRKDGEPANEAYQSKPEDLIGAYKRSKYEAEVEVQRAVAGGQDVVIVNPTTPIGPWDAKPTPTGEILVRFCTGRMPAYMDTGLNIVDVRDVAAGHIAAFERGQTGERYILGNENMTLSGLLERLAAITGRPAPTMRLPSLVPLAYSAIGEFIFEPLGFRPDVPFEGVRMAKQRMYYDTAKAAVMLGLAPRPVTRALSDAVTWFQEHGYLNNAPVREK